MPFLGEETPALGWRCSVSGLATVALPEPSRVRQEVAALRLVAFSEEDGTGAGSRAAAGGKWVLEHAKEYRFLSADGYRGIRAMLWPACARGVGKSPEAGWRFRTCWRAGAPLCDSSRLPEFR